LEVNSVEKRTADQVRKWRYSFDASSHQIERMLNEMEKRKQLEVIDLAGELRTSLDQFKEKNLDRLTEIEAFISKIDTNDAIQMDSVKSELDTIAKKVESLHADIVVEVVDTSKQRRSSTELARNTLMLMKVFEFNDPPEADTSSNSYNFLEPLANFVRRSSTTGASYYNAAVPDYLND
jgi:hypothetical protein